jgi:hypothetical protein
MIQTTSSGTPPVPRSGTQPAAGGTGQVAVTFTITGKTTSTAAPPGHPTPLALTGAPLAAEVGASVVLVVVGAVAAISARRRRRSRAGSAASTP